MNESVWALSLQGFSPYLILPWLVLVLLAVVQSRSLYRSLLLIIAGGCCYLLSTSATSLILAALLVAVSRIFSDRGQEVESQNLIIREGMPLAFLLFGLALLSSVNGIDSLFMLTALAQGTSYSTVIHTFGGFLVLLSLGWQMGWFPLRFYDASSDSSPYGLKILEDTLLIGPVLIVLIRFFIGGIFAGADNWASIVSFFAAVTLLMGPLLIFSEDRLDKRLSLGRLHHIGWMLTGLVVVGQMKGDFEAAGTAAIAYYFFYSVALVGMIALLNKTIESPSTPIELDDLNGLAYRRPWLSAGITLFALSLAGMPLTAGFIGRYVILSALMETGQWWLLAFVGLGSLLYSFEIIWMIVRLYRRSTSQVSLGIMSRPALITAIPCALIVCYWGLLPSQFLVWIRTLVGHLIYY